MEAPQALSTAHCAIVTEAGTLHFSLRRDRGLDHVGRHLAEPADRARAAAARPAAARRARNRSGCPAPPGRSAAIIFSTTAW